MNAVRGKKIVALLTAASCCLDAAPAAAATTATPPSQIFLSVETERINAKIERAPLKDVLAAPAREVSLSVATSATEAQRLVTVTLKDMALHQGLKELLGEMSYAISYKVEKSRRGESMTKASPARDQARSTLLFGNRFIGSQTDRDPQRCGARQGSAAVGATRDCGVAIATI